MIIGVGVKQLLIALQFLTILPVSPVRNKSPKATVPPMAEISNGVKISDGGRKPDVKAENFGKSLVYFPIIGIFIGLLLVLILLLFNFLPHLVTIALVLIASVVITGGIHLDGFADTCDGFYGSNSREKTLEIMRDSRIGVMGVIGIASILLLKFTLIVSIPQNILWKILILMAVFARWCQVWACYTSKYARKEGKAKYFIEHVGKKEFLLGAFFTITLFLLLMKKEGIILLGLSLLPIFLFINYVKRKIGGMTGDTIGATNEIAEIAVLFFALIYPHIYV